jgi:predicted RND superfamily exporter protein
MVLGTITITVALHVFFSRLIAIMLMLTVIMGGVGIPISEFPAHH